MEGKPALQAQAGLGDDGCCSLCPPPSRPSASPDPQPLREARRGCRVIPLSGSGWGLGWARGWRTSHTLPGAQTSQAPHPPSQAAAGAARLGPVTESRKAGPSAPPGGWRRGSGGGDSLVSGDQTSLLPEPVQIPPRGLQDLGGRRGPSSSRCAACPRGLRAEGPGVGGGVSWGPAATLALVGASAEVPPRPPSATN